MMKLTRSSASRLINVFEKAVDEYAFLGTIPVHSEDEEEQAAIDRERNRIISNRDDARASLLAALTA